LDIREIINNFVCINSTAMSKEKQTDYEKKLLEQIQISLNQIKNGQCKVVRSPKK